jgi:hypothetical protein
MDRVSCLQRGALFSAELYSRLRTPNPDWKSKLSADAGNFEQETALDRNHSLFDVVNHPESVTRVTLVQTQQPGKFLRRLDRTSSFWRDSSSTTVL